MPDIEEAPYPYARLVGSEVERASFAGGSVVQLVDGDPGTSDATVVDVYPAAVVVTSQRLVAAEGDLEWEWYLEDLEAVHHGGDERWTIVAVPGVSDHGVAVPQADVAEFRRALDRARDEAGRPPTSWDEEPEVASHPVESDDLTAAAGLTDDRSDDLGPAADVSDPGDLLDNGLEPEFTSTSLPVALVGAVDDPEDGLEPDDDLFDDVDPIEADGVDLTGELAIELDAEGHADPETDADLTGEIEIESEFESEPDVAAAERVRTRLRLRSRLQGLRSRNSTAPSVDLAAPMAALEAREISAWFGTHHVLDRVSLEMAAGQVTALIGPSGCGKSTFLRILNRMHEMIASASLSGDVLLDGEDIYDVNKKLADTRRHIGMVFQKPNPFPAMSIYDNVVASFRLTGLKMSGEAKDEVVEACLTKAGLWTEVRDRLRMPGGGLSGGQQQRLCIARALAIRPRVLLMDEPCSALDPTSTRRIEQTITELASEVTIVIVTHNMQQAARVSDRCAFFLAEQGTPGVIVEHGPTDVMFASPQDERTHDYVNGRFG